MKATNLPGKSLLPKARRLTYAHDPPKMPGKVRRVFWEGRRVIVQVKLADGSVWEVRLADLIKYWRVT